MLETEERKPGKWIGVIAGALAFPVYLLFTLLGKEELGRTAWGIVAVMIIAVRVRWVLRKHVWFWAVVVVLLLLQVPLLFLVRWPHGWTPAVFLLPFGIADYLLVLGALGLAERVMIKSPPADEV